METNLLFITLFLPLRVEAEQRELKKRGKKEKNKLKK